MYNTFQEQEILCQSKGHFIFAQIAMDVYIVLDNEEKVPAND